MIHTMAASFDDIENRTILDLGCGCGVLTIGCVMLGDGHVTGVDLDPSALDTAQTNLDEFDIDNVDLVNLERGLQLASRSVYSLHKTSTREHVLKKAEGWGAKPQVLAELRYDLPSTYKHHKKASVDIAVDFIRFDVS